MMAMAADEIVMAAHSQLGPIDPQLTITTPEGPRSAPAAAIKAQFAQAQEDLAANPFHTWQPGFRFCAACRQLFYRYAKTPRKLSKTMVKEWLQKYMFQGQDNAEEAADTVTLTTSPTTSSS